MFGNSSSNLDRQENYIKTFISQLVDGIIFLTTPLPQEHQSHFQIYDTPVVVIDPEFPYLNGQITNLYMVAADSEKGGFEVGQYLADKGHQRMAIIGGKEEVPPGSYRAEGFLRALHEVNLDAQVIWAGEHAEDGFKAAKELLTSPTPPTAIFACNDLLAMGVLRAACDLGIPVPEQLAVVGFDDIDMANYTCPRLTTVRQPKYEMGQVAAKFLINKIKSEKETGGGTNPTDDTALVKLDTELIIRESA
jgi:LacI family transcriptional regulator